MTLLKPRTFASHLALVALVCGTTPFLAAQEAPAPVASADAAALSILDTGRRAYNENKPDAAAERFREFLKQNAQKKEAPAAQYGLALALLDLPQKDFAAISAALQQVVAAPAGPERPFAFFHLASVQRTLGLQTLDQAAAKPNEAAALRTTANQNFTDALKNFSAAADAFAELLELLKSKPSADGSEQYWYFRSRCEECDLLLRLQKNKEAADLTQKLLGEKDVAKSAFNAVALYQSGYANFNLKDYPAAGRALSQLAPFDQPFGIHAHYLLSRIHHLADEQPEALVGYKALLADYDIQKKAATEAMKNPGALKPDDRARFEALLKPAPDCIVRASYYSPQLLAEAGEFNEALVGFNAFIQQYPTSSFIDEAKLRQAYCLLQVKNFAEVVKNLQPLQSHPQLADRALWWLARAQLNNVDPNNAGAVAQAVKDAIATFEKAAEKAGALGQSDAEAKLRRGDILLELANTQMSARMYKEAAATCARVCADYGATPLAEEALQRQASALHLGWQYKESDELCQKFEKTYPHSILLDAVWFTAAENAYFSATAAAADPNAQATRAQWEKKFDDAIDGYKKLLAKYPEFAYVNLARFALGTAQYKRGFYADAFNTLDSILDADRNGDLAQVNDLLADSLIRQFPPETNDALQAAQLLDRAEQAARLLDKYAASQGKAPQAADALLKLGYCYQRMGIVIVDPLEHQKTLTQARQIYEKILQEFGNAPALPQAVLERANCIALLGDINGALNEYNRFNGDPLKQSPLAPLALIRESTLLRTQNRHADAANLMADCRKRYEEPLKNDSLRAAWIPQLQLEHGLALKDGAKLAEARAIFEAIVKQFEKSPEAGTALWRAAQCRREEIQTAVAAAHIAQKKPGAKPEEIAAANKSLEDSLNTLKQSAETLKSEAAKLAAASETRQRMLYESAWSFRALADAEIEAARQKIAEPKLEKVLANIKKSVPNQPAPALSAPAVAAADIPASPSEKAAQDQYRAILTSPLATPLTVRARLELAEMLTRRGENDAALDLLSTALEDNPTPDIAERLQIRIATCLTAKDEPKFALVQAQAVLKNPASPLAGEAIQSLGEAYIQSKDWPNAIAQLSAFRDRDPFRNMNPLAERGLFRLSFAQAQAQKWDESRQSLEILIQRFGQSPLVTEARFNIGTLSQTANQLDNAYNNFVEVTRRTSGEMAAQAQLQMAKCRATQKRFPEALKDFLVVATIYEVPELSAEALTEAGQMQLELKQPAEATKLWQGVIKDFPTSKWAETAKKRLAGVK